MTSELTDAKYLLELDNLRDIITEELRLDAQIIERSELLPVSSLVITLESDYKERPRFASLAYLPLSDDECESIKLLQFYLAIPCEIKSDFQQAVEKVLLLINLKAPIGSFTINEESKEVVARYVYSLGKFKIVDKEEFLETFMLFMYTVDQFSGLIEEVAIGIKNYESVYKELL
ncbi:hypothetical protein NIES4071_85720 [Calothrix sp. NIES-4071]|nr:hypothetical protein NIES4071_85720 [Calothrix sp. NIES-4071]BAZ62839.1 hypothetical protein NIES4105_85650 [Calothrix sp. NIES-4105]